MNTSKKSVFAGLCAILALAVCAVPTKAQMAEVKEKPAMYSYVANWQIPRAHWAELSEVTAAERTILDKAVADGTIVGYGDDENLLHSAKGETHDDWWSSMSMAGLMKVLDQLTANNSATSVLSTATGHWDDMYESHYYNWKPGTYKGGYVHVSVYELKKDAPDNAVDVLSQHLVVPLLEKLLSSGTIVEYEIDEPAIHTSAPGKFLIIYVTPTAEGLDNVYAALMDTVKNHPLSGAAFGAMTEDSGHRDELLKGNAVFK